MVLTLSSKPVCVCTTYQFFIYPLNTTLNILASAESITKMKTAMIEVRAMTTVVEPISSSRVDQETFPSSAFTSRKKLTIFLNIFIFSDPGFPPNYLTYLSNDLQGSPPYYLTNLFNYLQGRRDLNPQAGIWSLVVCQLTDAPKFIQNLVWR